MIDRLYRSRDERMLAGVAGGLAERFDLDPSLVRVLWVLAVFFSGGLFLLAYLAMAIVVPEAPVNGDPWPGQPPTTPAPASAPGGVPGWVAPAAASSVAFSAGPSAASGDPLEPAPEIAIDTTSPVAEAPLWPSPPPGSPAPPGSSTPPVPPTPPDPLAWTVSERDGHREGRAGGAIIAGTILVLIGGYLLLRTMVPQIDLGAAWPVLLVVIGVILVIGSVRRGRSPGA
jgi:phage shock protein C